VARPVLVLDIRVVFALLIGVAHQDGDAGAGGAALEDAGQNLRLVRLFALRDDVTLTRTAPAEIDAQIVL
jgi:hypothetical protein